MTVLRPPRPPAPPALTVSREDIEFWDVDAQTVRLRVLVHNRGGQVSDVTRLSVGAAPLGAFLEPRPMGQIGVPPIPPGRNRVVTADFPRDDLPEVDLAPAARNPYPRWAASLKEVLGRFFPYRVQKPEFSKPCWVGGFHVQVEEAQAQRHCALAAELLPGRRNIIQFEIGTGTVGRYRVRFLGKAAQRWKLQLLCRGEAVELDHPCPFGDGHLTLQIEPPEYETTGHLAVEVTQESTGQVALVEFGFGVNAIAPGTFDS